MVLFFPNATWIQLNNKKEEKKKTIIIVSTSTHDTCEHFWSYSGLLYFCPFNICLFSPSLSHALYYAAASNWALFHTVSHLGVPHTICNILPPQWNILSVVSAHWHTKIERKSTECAYISRTNVLLFCAVFSLHFILHQIRYIRLSCFSYFFFFFVFVFRIEHICVRLWFWCGGEWSSGQQIANARREWRELKKKERYLRTKSLRCTHEMTWNVLLLSL